MNIFLILAFLFFIGSVGGWLLELFFRRFFSSANPEHKWINPGFCTGPYLPIYGCGLCLMFLIASLEEARLLPSVFWNRTVLFLVMAVCMTVVEYIAGLMLLKVFKVRLWDYRDEWGNIQGIICPKFSLFWALLGALYYFAVHPHILDALYWLSQNLAFSFFIGLFFGIFIIDASISASLVAKFRRFAEENGVIVRYEHLKLRIRQLHEKNALRYRFFRPLPLEMLNAHLKELVDTFEKRIGSEKKKA